MIAKEPSLWFVRVYGCHYLLENGYVPYLFRLTKKRNRFADRTASDEKRAAKKHCQPKKGWNLYGSRYAVRITNGVLEFSTALRRNLGHSEAATSYSRLASTLFPIHINTHGNECVPWGRSIVELTERSTGARRMLRFRFALGFSKPREPGRKLITPSNMISTMAEFSVIYDPVTNTWHFGK